MAIATAAAIGLGVAGVGTALGARASSKAAKKSAAYQAQTATENNNLAREFYGKNEGYLSPYVARGDQAGQALNSMLGLDTGQQAPPQPQPNAMSQFGGGMIYEGMDGPWGGYGGSAMGINAFAAPPAPQQPAPVNGNDAFRSYIANSDYGFQFGEGANKVNSGYAGAGTLQSGAAMKALEDYRQNLQQGYRNEFTNLLGNQQGVGLAGASALAGVGQNYVNTVSANNNNAADARSNAALIRGQNNPFANALGVVGGGLFGMGSGIFGQQQPRTGGYGGGYRGGGF